MKYLLGKKLGMAQVFNADGTAVPVTVIQTGSLTVIRAKTNERDGYEALQLGFGSRKQKNVARPQREEWKELGAFAVVREVRPPAGQARLPDGQAGGIPGQERGGQLDLTQFQEGDIVKVSGVSKGKGFQGVVKRHGFHGAPATHGTKHAHREPGSIGSTWPQRVVKGRRMAGRMGGERVTVRNLKVAKIDRKRPRLNSRH